MPILVNSAVYGPAVPEGCIDASSPILGSLLAPRLTPVAVLTLVEILIHDVGQIYRRTHLPLLYMTVVSLYPYPALPPIVESRGCEAGQIRPGDIVMAIDGEAVSEEGDCCNPQLLIL